MSFQELMLKIGEVLERRIIVRENADGMQRYMPRTFCLVIREGVLKCIWIKNKCRLDKIVAPVPEQGLTSQEWEDLTWAVRPHYQDYGNSLFGI
jgi:hypothetical protein